MVIISHFCTKNCQFSMNFYDNSKNKNRKIDFSFDSAHCTPFTKMGAKLRRGGGGCLHILTWDRTRIFPADLATFEENLVFCASFWTFCTPITPKQKIGIILDMIFILFQHIAHILCKDGTYLLGTGPVCMQSL